MKYSILPVTPLMQNCSLIWCEETMKGAAVDPGGDVGAILKRADEKSVELEKILVTTAMWTMPGAWPNWLRGAACPSRDRTPTTFSGSTAYLNRP